MDFGRSAGVGYCQRAADGSQFFQAQEIHQECIVGNFQWSCQASDKFKAGQIDDSIIVDEIEPATNVSQECQVDCGQ